MQSSGLWRHLSIVMTNVSEEDIATISRIERICHFLETELWLKYSDLELVRWSSIRTPLELKTSLLPTFYTDRFVCIGEKKYFFTVFTPMDIEKFIWNNLDCAPPMLPPPLIVVLGFERSWDPESYTGGSVATGRAIQVGQVEGEELNEEWYPGPPGWRLGVRLTTSHRKN
jgi:hypothetical protein